jgi:hypothetical protein
MSSIAASSKLIRPVLPTPAGIARDSSWASGAFIASISGMVSPVCRVRTPQETSKPTPPADITPPSSGSNAATPPIGKP